MSERLMNAVWAGLSVCLATIVLLIVVLGGTWLLASIHPVAGFLGFFGIVAGVSYGVAVYLDV